tara:strand:- start:26 stop:553 length:528 start_codon:yes stop_codon:yes gene_type:complete
MQINKLEVKNISYYARGSEETPCYNATVYINGKKAIEVSNDGHGGCDRQDTYPEIEERGLVQQADKWCVAKFGQETWEHGGKTYSTDLDLEHYCHQELYNWLDSKTLKKEMKKQYLCVDKKDDKEFLVAWKRPISKVIDDNGFQGWLKINQPHMVGKCLNFLPFDQALKLYKEYT